MTIERLAGLNKFLGPTQGIYLGNFKYGHTSFGLGDLSGNRFEILLRDIKPVATEGIYSADNGTFVQDKRQFISNLLTHLGTEGFLNYYGMQRFGQSKVCPTYCVGIAVLKNDWKEAIDLIMNPREGERDAIEEARILWKMTQQVKKALDKIPRRWVAERSILYYFSQPGVSTSDCLGAFQRIPHELRLMYLHSFQSLIWNQVASYRVSIFGKRPVIGDIVYSRENSKKDLKEDYEEINIENSEKNSKVIYVLKNETDLSNYTLADVLIPLPGYSIQYPSHLIPYYQELITSYGIPFDTFGKFGKQASITLAGSYRKLICIPKDLQAEFIQYEDPNESILEKDLDRLINPTQPDIKEKKTKDLESSRKYLGLKLSFSLPSSAYATMALREFLRVDTGAAYQRSLCPEPFKKL